jgi:hypothetical protein
VDGDGRPPGGGKDIILAMSTERAVSARRDLSLLLAGSAVHFRTDVVPLPVTAHAGVVYSGSRPIETAPLGVVLHD